MKHSLPITVTLAVMFILAQLIGLVIVGRYAQQALPLGIQPPEFDEQTSFIPLFSIIIIVTIITLILIHFKLGWLWKFWFFISVFITLTIAFGSFIPEIVAVLLALILTAAKIFYPTRFFHNLPELFIYAGLAAVFVPVLSILSISVLLILLAVYDMIAVWKTKHMVSMAKFQAGQKLFAGFYIPYDKKAAILGGGDIGFPLLFSAVLLKHLGLPAAILSVILSSFALLLLLIFSKKNKFYPAMPFLAAGCFAALGLTAIF